jgi:hypothetical protein
MKKAKDPRVEAELRIGQALFALGQGAGATRVSRGSIAAVRERYLDNFARRIEQDWAEGHDNWAVEGPNVLDRARAMGRLAAHLALCEGSMAIEERHLRASFAQVEKYHLGRFCEIPQEQKLTALREDLLDGAARAGMH